MQSPILLSIERYGMKHHKFTDEERKELLSCGHIAKVKGSNVEYTSSFKAYALGAKRKGKFGRQIFLDAGIPRWLLTESYVCGALRRWQKQSSQKGEVKVGRPRLKPEKSLDEMPSRSSEPKLNIWRQWLSSKKKSEPCKCEVPL